MKMLTAPLDRNGHGLPIPSLDLKRGKTMTSKAGAPVTFASTEEDRAVCISSDRSIKIGAEAGVYLPAECLLFVLIPAGQTLTASATDGDATICLIPLV